MKVLVKALGAVNFVLVKIEEVIMALSSFGLLAAIFIQVVCRYILKIPTPWAEELARYLFVWMSFVGSAYALAKGAHIEINLIDQVCEKYTKNPQRAKVVIEKTGLVLSIVFLVFFSMIFTEFLMSIAQRGQTSASMQISMVYPMSSILVGSVLTIFHALYLLVKPRENGGDEA